MQLLARHTHTHTSACNGAKIKETEKTNVVVGKTTSPSNRKVVHILRMVFLCYRSARSIFVYVHSASAHRNRFYSKYARVHTHTMCVFRSDRKRDGIARRCCIAAAHDSLLLNSASDASVLRTVYHMPRLPLMAAKQGRLCEQTNALTVLDTDVGVSFKFRLDQ